MGQEQSWLFEEPWCGDEPEVPVYGAVPCTGKPVSILVQLIHTGEQAEISEYRGQRVTSDWTVGHLFKPVEVRFRVCAASQRFTCLGVEAKETDTISKMMRCSCLNKLPPKVSIFLHLVDRDQFPQQHVPFELARVPLTDKDFERPKMSNDDGWWTLSWEAQEKHGLTAAEGIRAQVSPMHPLTFDRETQCQLHIPEDASHFCYSYPSPAWEVIESDADPYELRTWQKGSLEEHEDILDFLRIGAFMYVDKDSRIVGVNTLRPQSEGRAMCFMDGKPWLPVWTAALIARNRFQPVTMKLLREKGARYFVWLRPGEMIEGAHGEPLLQQPEIPHGGFAYIFHADLYTEDEEEVCLDRYFAVSAVSVPAMRRAQHFLERSCTHFEVVGRKAELEAEAPRTSEDTDEQTDACELTDPSIGAPWSVIFGAGV